jgi:hypothetical protein
MNTVEIIEKLQTGKVLLQNDFGIAQIGLFGSYAKGTFHENSDVDLVFKLEEDKAIGFAKYVALETYLKKIIE